MCHVTFVSTHCNAKKCLKFNFFEKLYVIIFHLQTHCSQAMICTKNFVAMPNVLELSRSNEIKFYTNTLAFFYAILFQFIGIWMTARFRNQNNPRANPQNFL